MIMKIFFLLSVFWFASGLDFCQSAKIEKRDDENIVVARKENRKYSLTAIFYGENDKTVGKIINRVVFRDNKTGAEVRYEPTGQIPAGNFYFTEVWSPDEEYLILPIGTFQGFGVFEAKDALKSIKENNYFDTIKVKSVNSGFFGHDFEKWEDNSTFSFKAGLDGDMFEFKYNAAKSELYCYKEKCEDFDIGINKKGEIKAAKKGNIEPTKIH